VGGRNANTQPSQIPGPLAAIMKTLLTFIATIIFQQASCQIASGLYKQYGDSTQFSELLLSSDSTFTYKHYEESCWGWYTVTGVWKQKQDSLILIDTSITEDLTIRIDTIRNFNLNFFTVTIVDERGMPLSGINVTYKVVRIDSSRTFFSDQNGEIKIQDNFIAVDSSLDSAWLDIRNLTIDCTRFSYGTYVENHFYIHKIVYNLLVTIKDKPLFKKLERVTSYKVTNDTLEWNCQKYLNKKTEENDCGMFWGNFKFQHK